MWNERTLCKQYASVKECIMESWRVALCSSSETNDLIIKID